MIYHSNMLGARVIIHDTEDIPREYWAMEAMIVNSWLDVNAGVPRYTLAVRIPSEPTRPLWDTGHENFGRQK